MYGSFGFKHILLILVETDLLVHINAMDLGTSLDERPIERITIVRNKDFWLGILNVFKEST